MIRFNYTVLKLLGGLCVEITVVKILETMYICIDDLYKYGFICHKTIRWWNSFPETRVSLCHCGIMNCEFSSSKEKLLLYCLLISTGFLNNKKVDTVWNVRSVPLTYFTDTIKNMKITIRKVLKTSNLILVL